MPQEINQEIARALFFIFSPLGKKKQETHNKAIEAEEHQSETSK